MNKCPKCGGKKESPDDYMSCEEKTIMANQGVCFSCAFWLVHIHNWWNDPNWVRIDGTSYYPEVILKEGQRESSHGYKGFGGRLFRIRFSDGRTIRTDNLWHQGTMPEWVQKQFPDNAEFVR